MDLQADINWIRAEIQKVTDPELIQVFKRLLENRAKQLDQDWFDTLPIEIQKEIEEGLREADQGKFIDHAEVMLKYAGRI